MSWERVSNSKRAALDRRIEAVAEERKLGEITCRLLGQHVWENGGTTADICTRCGISYMDANLQGTVTGRWSFRKT